MRIWDISPGYLNRQSLLGEHRELHAIVSILKDKKQGYSKHPETLRWAGYGWALKKRHQLLSAEMSFRGYIEKSPVNLFTNKNIWPDSYIDEPLIQFDLLKEKYIEKEQGRIPLPKSAQQLWSHHKYSVMARDPILYKEIGKKVSAISPNQDFSYLPHQLVMILKEKPFQGGIYNTLQHMWGYVSSSYPGSKSKVNNWSPKRLLRTIQNLTKTIQQRYLISSTAISELEAWL